MIEINSMTIDGKSIISKNGKVWIDGKDVTPQMENITIIVTGSIENLHIDACKSIVVTGNVGKIETSIADVTVNGDVTGYVESDNGNINCGNVGSNATTDNGNIKCKDIAGDAKTGNGKIEAGNVGGDVESDMGNITCANVTGSVKTDMGNIKYNK